MLPEIGWLFMFLNVSTFFRIRHGYLRGIFGVSSRECSSSNSAKWENKSGLKKFHISTDPHENMCWLTQFALFHKVIETAQKLWNSYSLKAISMRSGMKEIAALRLLFCFQISEILQFIRMIASSKKCVYTQKKRIELYNFKIFLQEICSVYQM
jgi:hypothetical protein